MSKLKLMCWLLVLVLLVGGAAVGAWKAGLLGRKYTAKATLLLAPCQPRILSRAAEKYDPLEFEMFCNTQKSIFKDRFIITAALRNPKLKKRACIAREDAKNNTLIWLTEEIHVDFPEKNSGIMVVSASEPDRDDAAAMVNAVVDAYMTEVVDRDRLERRNRLGDLSKIYTEKEEEVRLKRQALKQELENSGAGDEQTMAAREQLAVQMYAQFEAEFQRMRADHRNLIGSIKEAKMAMEELPKAEIPEIQLAVFVNNNPMYRDLQNRFALLELESNRLGSSAGTAAAEQTRIKADLAKTSQQLQGLEARTSDLIRDALRIELRNNFRRLECQEEICREQLATFEKQVERSEEAYSVGRTSIAAQMAKTEVEDIERVLRAVAAERESLKIELGAENRVRVLGDRNQPAAVPEVPD